MTSNSPSLTGSQNLQRNCDTRVRAPKNRPRLPESSVSKAFPKVSGAKRPLVWLFIRKISRNVNCHPGEPRRGRRVLFGYNQSGPKSDSVIADFMRSSGDTIKFKFHVFRRRRRGSRGGASGISSRWKPHVRGTSTPLASRKKGHSNR